MAKKKQTTEETAVYRVLIPCSGNGQDYAVGDMVTAGDFSKKVIDNWLEIIPPVLEKVS